MVVVVFESKDLMVSVPDVIVVHRGRYRRNLEQYVAGRMVVMKEVDGAIPSPQPCSSSVHQSAQEAGEGCMRLTS